MDCDKASYRVYRYLDGELTVWRRWTIRRHLDIGAVVMEIGDDRRIIRLRTRTARRQHQT